ncbi:unnamed protein product [Phaedon cochleariae]|uniref:Tubulin--tyrosine ligase-like protein 5 n=1 Tax=Phaedon cochleariae TaxID=80249 RepID=A0A9P0DQX9_PHACE|nr:unnamed protein product [Phaedon cochleariae]
MAKNMNEAFSGNIMNTDLPQKQQSEPNSSVDGHLPEESVIEKNTIADSEHQSDYGPDIIMMEGYEIASEEPNCQNEDSSAWLSRCYLGNSILIFKSSSLANSSENAIQNKPGFKLHITYKVLQAETKLLSKLLKCHGVTEVAPNSSDFNLLWTGSHPKPETLRALASHQRVNHFPRSYELTRKDRLYKNIERMQQIKGLKHFDFIPQTFIMPYEYRELCTTHLRIKGPWIVKPVASSRGRGIFLAETPNQVPAEENLVVAKYISNPLLVAGRKCDLRLYVVVTSFDPLLIYIYEEGLVRFATVKYDSNHKQLWNPCMHLCNYSINKYHSDYLKSDDPSAENVGHKWTLSALLRYLKSEGRDTLLLMSQIEDLIIKAIIATGNSIITACKMFVPHVNNAFELFGFDILIDKNLKPWLLEVNLSPSLNCDSPLDVRLKAAMLADLLTLVGIPAVDPMMINSGSHSQQCDSNFKLRNGQLPMNKIFNASSHSLSEENNVVRNAMAQFQRRGGFVRIFPASDSWDHYSQYLDPSSGIPISGIPTTNIGIGTSYNYNLILHKNLYPEIILGPKHISNCEKKNVDRKIEPQMSRSSKERQNRYERKSIRGSNLTVVPTDVIKEFPNSGLKSILDMLKNGKRITQCDARKIFSRYLVCVLKNIVERPDKSEYIEMVLKFLQRASHFLKSPLNIFLPQDELNFKDKAAMVAKQLSDFLCLYNNETELFVDKQEIVAQIPSKLIDEFLKNARESELEEILVYQTMRCRMTSVSHVNSKSIHITPRSRGTKTPTVPNRSKKSKVLVAS